MLSIDCGGIPGLIPALVLADIQRRTGRPIAELFDLIAGTSTGGVIALACPAGPGARRNTAPRSWPSCTRPRDRRSSTLPIKRVASLGGLIDERYHHYGLKTVLDTYFGDARLKEALADVLISGYDLENRFAFFFKSSSPARRDDGLRFPDAEVARATSAAPTYFEPVEVTEADGPDITR